MHQVICEKIVNYNINLSTLIYIHTVQKHIILFWNRLTEIFFGKMIYTYSLKHFNCIFEKPLKNKYAN